MTFRKRRVSHSRYNGNEIDDTLWISLVAVSSAIMKRVGTGGYKGLLPTEMNTLYSEVPGAPNYTEEGFSSMFYHEIDEPALPNQRPSDIGLATKHGLERSGLYFAAKFYDLETFKKSWKRIPTSVQDKLKRAKADGGYGLDINYLKSFFSGANHFQRRSDLFKLFLKHKKIGKKQLRGDIQNAILATTKKSERRRLKKQLADMSDEPTSEECSSDGSDRPSPKNCSKGYSSSRGRHHSSSSRRRHSDSEESDGSDARRPPRPSKPGGGHTNSSSSSSSSGGGADVAFPKQRRTRITDPKLGLVTASGRCHRAGERQNENLQIPEYAHKGAARGLGAPDIKGASSFQQLDAALETAASAAGDGGARAAQVPAAAVAGRGSFSRIASQLGSGSAGMTAADFARIVAEKQRDGSAERRFLLSVAGELSGTAVARSSGAQIVGAGGYSQYRGAVDDAEKQQGYGDSGGAGHVSAVERQKQNANALLHLAAGASGAHHKALHVELAKMSSLDPSTLDGLSSEIEEPPPRIGQPAGHGLVERADLMAGMIFEEQMKDGSGFSGNNYIEKGILYTVVGRLRGDFIYDHGEEYDAMSDVLFVLKHGKGETVAKKLKDSTKSSATNGRFNGAIERGRKSYHGQPHYDGSGADRLIPIPGFTAETAAEASYFIKHDQVTGEAEVGWYEWSPEAFKELRYYDWHLPMPAAAATAASSSSSSSAI